MIASFRWTTNASASGSMEAVVWLTAALTMLSGSAWAESDAVARGAQIPTVGNGHGAIACASCHAFNGMADPSGAFPRLAGQTQTYILRSLNNFADGLRRNTIMTRIAGALTGPQRADMAAYYASVSAPVPPFPPADPKSLSLGEEIANVGLNPEQIPACADCHGPRGHSVTPSIPSLAGQYANYITFELKMFRSGARRSGREDMAGLAHALSEEQISAVSAYFQSIAGTASLAKPASTPATRGTSR
jgi:cytochrome c553